MNESEALLFPQAWDKGGRIHLEDNITQQLAQVCTPTSLHKTVHMNEILHLHADKCGEEGKLVYCIADIHSSWCLKAK